MRRNLFLNLNSAPLHRIPYSVLITVSRPGNVAVRSTERLMIYRVPRYALLALYDVLACCYSRLSTP